MIKKYFSKRHYFTSKVHMSFSKKKNISNLDANKNLDDLNQNIYNLFKKVKHINKNLRS